MIHSKHKSSIQSAFGKSSTEWVQVIQEKIAEPYMQGWVASIIWWDLALDDLSDRGAAEIKPLESLASLYTPEIQKLCFTAELEKALALVGYEQAEVRCALKTDAVEGSSNRGHGAYEPLDRRWSSHTVNGVAHV